MKIKIPLSLRLLSNSETYYKGDFPVLCNYLLHDFFSFPQDTPEITITISTKPMDDSYEVKMPVGSNSMKIHYNEDWNYTTMFYTAKGLVMEYCDKWDVETLFVSLEY